MPVYQPGIPTGTVNLDVDYQNLQDNFQQLDIAYGVDHVPFSNNSGVPPAPGGISGMHTIIHLQSKATPAALVNVGQLFNAVVNDGIDTDTILYYLTGKGKLLQLTSNYQPALTTNGATFLPGGLILNWGANTIPANPTTQVISFTRPYSSAAGVFSITVSRRTADTSTTAQEVRVITGSITASQFQVVSSSSSSANVVYWMAIGK